jgi:hypothetical protein
MIAPKNYWRVILCGFIIVVIADPGNCQTGIVPNINSPFQNRLTLQNGGDNAGLTIHHDALGRPCLDIEAAARAHVINPNLYDHVISVYNRCIQQIKLRICYYNSDHCIDMEIRGSERKDGVLGVYPNMKYFRYSFREKF